MPVSPTYPGVYIQEVDSGSRVVTGVATSITAFVGRTPRGPIDEPVMVYDWGSFQQTYGGRAKNMPLTYAVEDFFGNGGGQALIARVVGQNAVTASLPAPAAAKPAAATPAAAAPSAAGDAAAAPAGEAAAAPATPAATPAAAPAAAGPLRISASSPGEWGNTVNIALQQIDPKVAKDIIARYPAVTLDATKFAMVYVGFPATGQSGLAVEESLGPVYIDAVDIPVRIDYVLEAQSVYIRSDVPTAGQAPPAAAVATTAALAWTALSGGTEGNAITSNDLVGDQNTRTGMYLLEHADMFNILVIPGDQGPNTPDTDLLAVLTDAAAYCSLRKAILIAEPLSAWSSKAIQGQFGDISPSDLNIGELDQRRRVFAYFPLIKKLDAENANRETLFTASGMIAGVFAGTDVRRGVWKAPAGIEAGLTGVTNLQHKLTDMQNGVLNQVGVNVLRDFPVIGKVIWGSRTLAGADALSDDYKYLPVRRLTDYIELSLFRASKFAVFEPNADPLWSQLRLMCDAFMADLNRQGAFYRYYVQCDKTTTTQLDIDRGRVNVIIAFAPVKPAEFVILTIQQLAGQTAA